MQTKFVSRNFFAFLNASYPKTHLIQCLNSFESSRPYGRLLENKKQGDLRNYFCLKMISKIAPQKFFQKIIQISEAWKQTKDMKFRLEFFCPCSSTYELNIILKLFWALNRNIFKVPYVLRAKLKKISQKD